MSLAKECVNQGCGIHMFVLSQQDVGGAWPGHIPYLTGGALHTYGYLQVYEELQPLEHLNWHKMNTSNPKLTVVKQLFFLCSWDFGVQYPHQESTFFFLKL